MIDLTNEKLIELNKLTKYPKIYTLFDRDKNFKLIKGVLNKKLIGIKNIKKFILTEKIDGTNCGIVLKPVETGFNVYIRKRSRIVDYDKEHKIYHDAVNSSVNLSKVFDFFNESKQVITLFGEVCGGNIQKFGKTYSEKPTFKLFDIKCGDNFFDWRSLLDFSKRTGINTVGWENPSFDVLNYDDLLKELKNRNKKNYFEGFVIRSEQSLLNNFGERMIFKIKLKDFLEAQNDN